MTKNKLSCEKFFYSVAIVSKYNILKALICSYPNWKNISNKIEEVFSQHVLTSIEDFSRCKIKSRKESIQENVWILAGELVTEERCYSHNRYTKLFQIFEVHIIKSIYRPHPGLPPIGLWCNTCVKRVQASKIIYPRLEAQYTSDGSDSKIQEKIKYTEENTKKPTTKYDVKLIHISSGYRI